MRIYLERALRRSWRRDFSACARQCRHDFDFARSWAADATSVNGAHLIREETMAVIRDVMAAFELLQPTSIADAQKLLQQHGENAWIMAGGMDTFDWLKDRIRKPKV